MTHSLADKLAQFQRERQSDLALLVAPRIARLPLAIQRYDDPFLPFGKAIIRATSAAVCAYLFDLAAYLAAGAAGAVALERTIAYAKDQAIAILHGPFTGAGYTPLVDETSFNADAVTLAGVQDAVSYAMRPDRAVFVMRQGQPRPVEASANIGSYWKAAGLLTLPAAPAAFQMRLAGEDVLYAGRGDDFALQTRAALEKKR